MIMNSTYKMSTICPMVQLFLYKLILLEDYSSPVLGTGHVKRMTLLSILPYLHTIQTKIWVALCYSCYHV